MVIGMPTLSGTVRRPSPTPRYLEVARHIEAKRRELSKPLRMPAEPALASEYRVARDTLRRALVELEKTGAVTRQRGRGRGTYLRPLHTRPSSVKGKTIAFVPPWWMTGMDEWFMSLAFDGVSKWGDAHDCRLSVLNVARWESDEHKLLEKLSSRDVAGLVWVHPVPEQKKLLNSVARHMPCVVIGREYEGDNLHVVLPDYGQAARLFDSYLTSRGHSIYSVVGRSTTDPYGAAWIKAFQDAQAQRGGYFEDRNYYLNVTPFSRDRMPDLLLDMHFDFQPETRAVVLTTSSHLTHLLASERFRNAVPQQISLAAFDYGIQPTPSYWPGHLVTHVTCDWKEIGRKSIEVIFSAIEGEDVPAMIRQPVTLVEGDTVVPAAGQSISPGWAKYHEGLKQPGNDHSV